MFDMPEENASIRPQSPKIAKPYALLQVIADTLIVSDHTEVPRLDFTKHSRLPTGVRLTPIAIRPLAAPPLFSLASSSINCRTAALDRRSVECIWHNRDGPPHQRPVLWHLRAAKVL
jgi:hypothetical protein